MNDTLVIPRPIAYSEILRTADFLVVFPEEKHTVEKEYFSIPEGILRNFFLTNKSNVGEVSINICGQTIWSHTFSENETIELPFWRDLDVYDSTLLGFCSKGFCLKAKDPNLPFSLEISYTPLHAVSEIYQLKFCLKYLYKLGQREYLLATEGSARYLKEDDKDFEDYMTPKVIQSHVVDWSYVDRYNFRIYTHNPISIQKDEKLAEIASVSKNVVVTYIATLDVIVSSVNLERFKTYMKETYPNAEVDSGVQATQINEVQTARLRMKHIEKLAEQWEKVLESFGRVPEEISEEEFKNMPKDSEYVKKHEKSERKHDLDWLIFSRQKDIAPLLKKAKEELKSV